MNTATTGNKSEKLPECEILGVEKHASLYSPELALCAVISPIGVLGAAIIVGVARVVGWRGGHRLSLMPCKNNPNGLDSTVSMLIVTVIGLFLALVLAYFVPSFYIPKPYELLASAQLTEGDIFAIHANFFWIMNICGGLWVSIRESTSAYKVKGVPAHTSPLGIGWRAG